MSRVMIVTRLYVSMCLVVPRCVVVDRPWAVPRAAAPPPQTPPPHASHSYDHPACSNPHTGSYKTHRHKWVVRGVVKRAFPFFCCPPLLPLLLSLPSSLLPPLPFFCVLCSGGHGSGVGVPSGLRKGVFSIGGMSCASCVRGVEKAVVR